MGRPSSGIEQGLNGFVVLIHLYTVMLYFIWNVSSMSSIHGRIGCHKSQLMEHISHSPGLTMDFLSILPAALLGHHPRLRWLAAVAEAHTALMFARILSMNLLWKCKTTPASSFNLLTSVCTQLNWRRKRKAGLVEQVWWYNLQCHFLSWRAKKKRNSIKQRTIFR